MIVIAKRGDVEDRFPIPLINRLEKHFLAISTVLSPQQKEMAEELDTWVARFSKIRGSSRKVEFAKGDAFIGYHQDTAAALIRIASDLIDTDTNRPMRTRGGKAFTATVLSRAKEMLMMMCPPDALARLTRSNLSDEAHQCWDVYFKQQKHENLAAFLLGELASSGDGQSLSVQVTTHSRLLSTIDAKQIAEQINVSPDSLHCMLLQQLDTEQQFCREISEFFSHHASPSSSKFLFVQCDEGDQHSDLLACARHRLHEERVKAESYSNHKLNIIFHVVFIIHLPRMAGGCFEGTQGGFWRSVHIDELRSSSSGQIPHITSLVGRSISTLWSTSAMGLSDTPLADDHRVVEVQADHMEDIQLSEQFEAMAITSVKEEVVTPLLPVGQLLTACIQRAVSRLEDTHGPYKEVEDHIRKRILLFQSLFSAKAGRVGHHFVAILSKHILKVLLQWDERLGEQASGWVETEALSTTAIQASGTFQQALWLKLQSVISPILSELIADFDCDGNLRLLSDNARPWLQDFWLRLFDHSDAISLAYEARATVPVCHHGTRDRPFTCQVPFVWRVKSQMDMLLEQARSSKEQSGTSLVACLRSAVPLASIGKIIVQFFELNSDYVKKYMMDYIRMTHHAAGTLAQQLVAIALESAQQQVQLVDDIKPVVFDLAALHVADSYVHARLHCMVELLNRLPTDVHRRCSKSVVGVAEEMVRAVRIHSNSCNS